MHEIHLASNQISILQCTARNTGRYYKPFQNISPNKKYVYPNVWNKYAVNHKKYCDLKSLIIYSHHSTVITLHMIQTK